MSEPDRMRSGKEEDRFDDQRVDSRCHNFLPLLPLCKLPTDQQNRLLSPAGFWRIAGNKPNIHILGEHPYTFVSKSKPYSCKSPFGPSTLEWIPLPQPLSLTS